MSLRETEKEATVRVENIGGIDETTVSLSSGVTVLSGRNATNRTSFLQAIMGVCGSDEVTVKGDADEGSIELSIGSETYSRTVRQTNGTVASSGQPYLADTTLADLFAFLLESNDARRAVVRGDDLRELIMRPVDTDEIQAEIEQLRRERRQIDTEIEDIDSEKEELPSLEEKRTQLREQIETKNGNWKRKRKSSNRRTRTSRQNGRKSRS
jgi:DNA repair ATPase RecN